MHDICIYTDTYRPSLELHGIAALPCDMDFPELFDSAPRFAASPVTLASRDGWSVVEQRGATTTLRWMVSQEACALDQTRVGLVDGKVDRSELRALSHQIMALLVAKSRAEAVGHLEKKVVFVHRFISFLIEKRPKSGRGTRFRWRFRAEACWVVAEWPCPWRSLATWSCECTSSSCIKWRREGI